MLNKICMRWKSEQHGLEETGLRRSESSYAFILNCCLRHKDKAELQEGKGRRWKYSPLLPRSGIAVSYLRGGENSFMSQSCRHIKFHSVQGASRADLRRTQLCVCKCVICATVWLGSTTSDAVGNVHHPLSKDRHATTNCISQLNTTMAGGRDCRFEGSAPVFSHFRHVTGLDLNWLLTFISALNRIHLFFLESFLPAAFIRDELSNSV